MTHASPEIDFRKIKVLVIDDDHWLRLLIKKYLTVFGVTDIFEAENGIDGFAFLNEDKPDLVLCDIHMPDLDGFEFLKHLRSSRSPYSTVPVIFLTGDPVTDYLPRAEKLGAAAVLFKPVSAQELKSKMIHVLTRGPG